MTTAKRCEEPIDYTERREGGNSKRSYTVITPGGAAAAVDKHARAAVCAAALHGLTGYGTTYADPLEYPGYKPRLGAPNDWPRIYSIRIKSRKATLREIREFKDEQQEEADEQ